LKYAKWIVAKRENKMNTLKGVAREEGVAATKPNPYLDETVARAQERTQLKCDCASW
jgi:hypothetical protein